MQELALEKRELRRTQHDLKKQHVQLMRDKASKEQQLAELDARAYDVQILKFGQVINLGLLDKVGPAQGADDLRTALRAQEAEFAGDVREWDRKIAARTEELAALTQVRARLGGRAAVATAGLALRSDPTPKPPNRPLSRRTRPT